MDEVIRRLKTYEERIKIGEEAQRATKINFYSHVMITTTILEDVQEAEDVVDSSHLEETSMVKRLTKPLERKDPHRSSETTTEDGESHLKI